VRAYRPFPTEAIYEAVKEAKIVAVVDKSLSVGQGGPLATDVKAALYNKNGPPVLSCIAGMGGRDVRVSTIESIVDYALGCMQGGKAPDIAYIDFKPHYLGMTKI